MKITWLLLFVFTGACANRTSTVADSLAVGKVIDTVICRSDPSQSYALYIPAKAGRLPVVYFFDSHGAGALPVNKYKSLADAYGFILVGSNNSRNGNDYTSSDHIWLALAGDTRDRLMIDTGRVYVCGFSGGAKVASYLAIMHPEVKGLIVNGAGLPDETPVDNFDFGFTILTGEGDLNMTDLVALDNRLDSTRTRHRILFFDGKHEWAPDSAMATAFSALQFDAMRQGVIPKDDASIGRYAAQSRVRLSAYRNAGQLIKAERECQVSISLLDGLSGEVGWFKENAASISGNAVYKKQQSAVSASIAREQATKEVYMDHFGQPDKAYWVTTIDSLQKTTGPMSQRLLAFLSLEFYMYSNHLLNNGASDEARYFLDLYKLVDPTNSEAWYLSAVLYARQGQTSEAENELRKAVSCGFNDRVRMLQQPEFRNLSSLPLPGR